MLCCHYSNFFSVYAKLLIFVMVLSASTYNSVCTPCADCDQSFKGMVGVLQGLFVDTESAHTVACTF